MKYQLVTLGLILGVISANAENICKTGDLKDCARVLKEKEAGEPAEFRAAYDEVCLENKSFKCVKTTIRGEPKEELAYQKTQYPHANLFLTKEGTEDKIYRLEKKDEVTSSKRKPKKVETKVETKSETPAVEKAEPTETP
jgi:hypothetical protein